MAFPTVKTWTDTELVDATMLNEQIKDSLNAIWKGTTEGDIDYYTSATAKSRLGIGTALQILRTNAGATAPEWATVSLDAASVVLTPMDSLPPLSGVQSAGYEVAESSGAGTAKPIIPKLLFDDTTDEARMFIFRLPGTVNTTPSLKIKYYMASANSSKKVKFSAQLAALSDTDTNATAKVFDSANTVSVDCPNDAGTIDEATITMTNNSSLAKDDWVCLFVQRVPSDTTNDTATGDVAVIDICLSYGSE